MRVTLNGITARLLLALLSPFTAVSRLFRPDDGPAYESTVEGSPLDYRGNHPLLVAVWASWAPVWRAGTEGVVADLKAELAGRCEFAYVRDTDQETCRKLNATVLPVLIVFHNGNEVARFVNVLQAEEVRSTLDSLISDR